MIGSPCTHVGLNTPGYVCVGGEGEGEGGGGKGWRVDRKQVIEILV